MIRLAISGLTISVFLILGSCSFSGDPRKKQTTEFVLHQDFYLYRVKHSDAKSTDLRLWKFELIGEDEIHYKIARIPAGTKVLAYGNISEKRSFYAESYIQFFGAVKHGAKDYFFKAGMTQSDFSKLERPWENENTTDVKHKANQSEIATPRKPSDQF